MKGNSYPVTRFDGDNGLFFLLKIDPKSTLNGYETDVERASSRISRDMSRVMKWIYLLLSEKSQWSCHCFQKLSALYILISECDVSNKKSTNNIDAAAINISQHIFLFISKVNFMIYNIV